MLKHAIILATGLTLLVFSGANGADDGHPTYTNPKTAGPDFKVQGEYAGTLHGNDGNEVKWGAQVIALGDGKFHLAGFRGGLPGDGWKRDDFETQTDGKTNGGQTTFFGDGWLGTISDGTLRVEANGSHLGDLKKVHRKSPTLGAKPPAGAIVLFDGKSADKWVNGHVTDHGDLLADTSSKMSFGDHKLHLEFRTPFKPHARGQARGNSGVYIQSRYELQVLDSFGLSGENNECGGFYQVRKPKVNMCYPPLQWQTYDIDFTAARYNDAGKKTSNARVTVKHNGVLIHDDLELPRGTPGRLAEGPGDAPIYLQGHGNPVVYRNIWVVLDK